MSHKHLALAKTTKETVGWPVAAQRFAGIPLDPTSLPVAIGFAVTPDAALAVFTAATWVTDATVTPNLYWATVQVGLPGSGATVELAPGTWHVWVRLTATPDVPVHPAGLLTVA